MCVCVCVSVCACVCECVCMCVCVRVHVCMIGCVVAALRRAVPILHMYIHAFPKMIIYFSFFVYLFIYCSVTFVCTSCEKFSAHTWDDMMVMMMLYYPPGDLATIIHSIHVLVLSSIHLPCVLLWLFPSPTLVGLLVLRCGSFFQRPFSPLSQGCCDG